MRSCHASAYGQWLQVNTITVAPSPLGADQDAPSVSGSSNSGALSPIATLMWSPRARGRLLQRLAQIVRVWCWRDPAVAATVDATAQADLVALGAREVLPVDQDRRRAAKARLLGLGVGVDLASPDLGVAETDIRERLAQLRKRPLGRRAALPPQQLEVDNAHIPRVLSSPRRSCRHRSMTARSRLQGTHR